jgi:hypothetical protein
MPIPQGALERAVARANHFQHVDLAVLWEEAGKTLAGGDEGAARAAFSQALTHYTAYNAAWREHLPASRWDHDYAPELAAMKARVRGLSARELAPETQGWVRDLLEGRATDAANALLAADGAPIARAHAPLVRVVAWLCGAAGEEGAASRLGARAARS